MGSESRSGVAALIVQGAHVPLELIERELHATQRRCPSAITAPTMSTARARLLSLLTLALLVPTVSIAHAQDSIGDEESIDASALDASAPDASVTHASTGGTSSHSTSVVSSGFGGTNGGGKVELPGPDLSSCSCHVVGRRHLRAPGLGLLLLGTVGALMGRRKRSPARTSPNKTTRAIGLE